LFPRSDVRRFACSFESFFNGDGLASKKRTVKSSHLVNYFWFRSQLGTGN
jgi:hypothetical protein